MHCSSYYEYFKNLARSHKQIAHGVLVDDAERNSFFGINADESIRQAVSGTLNFPILVIQDYSGQLEDQDIIKERLYGSLEVRDKAQDYIDNDGIATAKERCKQIGLQLIASMYRTMEDEGNQGPVPAFNINSVRYSFTGPYNDAEYGCKFTFEFADVAFDPFSFNPDDYFNK